MYRRRRRRWPSLLESNHHSHFGNLLFTCVFAQRNLKRMNDDLQRLDTEVTMALTGLDARVMQLAPRDRVGKWNMQQIVEHLQLAIEVTICLIRERLEKGRALEMRPTLGQRFGQWLVLSRGWLPTGRKAPAVAIPSRPVTLKTGNQLADRLHGALVEFDRVGVKARVSFGQRGVAVHSRLGAMTFAQWSRFHRVHGEHHLKQIARIRQEWGV